VNGAAVAGGTGLALLCDFTLAVPEAKFGYTEVRIGFVPAIVSTFLLRQVGERLPAIFAHGTHLRRGGSAENGADQRDCPGEKLLDRARELAACCGEQSLVASSYQTLADRPRARAARYANGNGDSRECRIRESADFREGITSFLEKRKPKWTADERQRLDDR